MLNDKVVLEWAQAFAARALVSQDPVARAFQLAYSRTPDPWEKGHRCHLLSQAEGADCRSRCQGEKLALPAKVPEGMDTAYAAAFVDFCEMLLNSNEFVYQN